MMSKEYLEALARNIRYKKEHIGNDTYRLYIKKNDVELLEQALQRLESIDNAIPSEALECLEDIYRNGIFISDYDALGKQHPTNISPETNKSISEQCDTIKRALLKAQEQEKVLDIIKKKRIDIESFYKTFIEDNYDYNDYEICYGTYGLELLTEEEFDLLKRWLG